MANTKTREQLHSFLDTIEKLIYRQFILEKEASRIRLIFRLLKTI